MRRPTQVSSGSGYTRGMSPRGTGGARYSLRNSSFSRVLQELQDDYKRRDRTMPRFLSDTETLKHQLINIIKSILLKRGEKTGKTLYMSIHMYFQFKTYISFSKSLAFSTRSKIIGTLAKDGVHTGYVGKSFEVNLGLIIMNNLFVFLCKCFFF